MTESTNNADWRQKYTFSDEAQSIFNRIGLFAIVLLIVLLVGVQLFDDSDYFLNLYTDIVALMVTVGIIEWLNSRARRRALIAQLIREASGRDAGITFRAFKELEDMGCLKNGRLQGHYFAGANWSYTILPEAQLPYVHLTSANLEHANMSQNLFENSCWVNLL